MCPSDHQDSDSQIPHRRDHSHPHPRHPAARSETLADIERRLKQSGYLALRRIRCEFRDGVLRLRGQLPSHYLKQVAAALAAEVKGVQAVANELKVVRPARGEAAGPTACSA